jgi:hypothetical protein
MDEVEGFGASTGLTELIRQVCLARALVLVAENLGHGVDLKSLGLGWLRDGCDSAPDPQGDLAPLHRACGLIAEVAKH